MLDSLTLQFSLPYSPQCGIPVITFRMFDCVALQFSVCIYDVRTQERVNILRQKLAKPGPIL